MSARPVEVITFDLWDTIVIDDSDEAKRAAAGLPSKRVARRDLFYNAVNKVQAVERSVADLAYDLTDGAFNKVWHDQHVTWVIGERMRLMLAGLGVELPEADFAELVHRHEVMELEYRPDPVPGVHEALRALQKKYKLAIVSDAIVSPGRCLRELLDGEGLLECFDAFAFSDEVGASKPAPAVFEYIAKECDCSLSGIVHIGDREHNDIGGPHAVGARGVFFTAAKDRGSATSKGDAICHSYADLPGVIDELNG
jgi:putative hydrolase of the HAD superfamily